MKNKVFIRDFHNKIIGSIETDSQGNKVIRDFYNRILGRYDAKTNLTKDFYGRIIARGDHSSALITMNANKNHSS